MANKYFILIVLLSASLAWGQPEVGDALPGYSLPDTSGQIFTEADVAGNVVMYSFFAAWCQPCSLEAPLFESGLWKPFKDRGFVLLGINLEEAIWQIREFVAATGITYPILMDEESDFFMSMGLPGIPANVITDRKGIIAYAEFGFNLPEMSTLIDSLLSLTALPTSDPPPVIAGLELIGSYPNPFNPLSTIRFRLEHRATVHLQVYDSAGRRLHRERVTLGAGQHDLPIDMSAVASGTYPFILRTDREFKSGKLVLQK